MKKLLFFIMLFVNAFVFSQTLTIQSINCSNITLTVNDPSIPNGTYSTFYEINRVQTDATLGIIDDGSINITMTGGVGSFTIPTGTKVGYRVVTIGNSFDASNPFNYLVSNSYYKDGWDIDFPLTLTKINQYTSIECQYSSVVDPDEPLFLIINETCPAVFFGCGATSLNPPLFSGIPKYFEVTIQVTGANTGSFTSIYDASNNHLTVPPAYYQNLGNTRFHIISMRELGTDTLSSWGADCDPVQIISFSPNTYFIDLEVQEFTPLFDFSDQNVSLTNPICLGNDGTVTINSSTLADGFYDIQYNYAVDPFTIGDFLYSDTAYNVQFISGVATFQIPTSTNNDGLGYYNFSPSNIQQAGGSCSWYFTTGLIPFEITTPIDINIGTNSVVVTEPLCLGNGGIVTFNSSSLPDGTYDIDFTLSGVNTGSYTATGVVVSGGTSTFNILAANLTSAGTTTIEINSIINGGCVSSVNSGTITDSFEATSPPDISGTNSVVVTEPLCLGNGGIVTFSSSSLADGNYDFNFTLSGANTGNATESNITVSGGVAIFNISSTLLTNAGITDITINWIAINSVGCASYPSSTISDSFEVTSPPDISGTNSVVVTEPLCLGSGGIVTFNSSSLPDGNYDFNFTLSGANTGNATESNITVSGGVAIFNISSTLLTNAGITDITINWIAINSVGCASYPSSTISDSFEVTSPPDISGTNSVVVTEPLCLGNGGIVTFNSSSLADGNYDFNFTLSGANTGNATESNITVSGGVAIFNISSTLLTNAGITDITINWIAINSVGCASYPSSTISDSFEVLNIPDTSGTNDLTGTNPYCLGSDVVLTLTSTSMADGAYNLNYTLYGSNTGSFIVNNVVMSSGTAIITLPSSNFPNIGNTNVDINDIILGTTGCPVTFVTGTLHFDTIINNGVDLTGINSVSVAEPICLGNDGVVTFNASALVDGTYDIDFTLSGANTGSYTASGVVVSGGTSTFNILAANLASVGTTTISIDVVTNTTSSCTTNVSAGTITDSFVITALPDVTSGTQSVSVAEPICLGNDGVVTFNASALVDGTYDIDFTLSGANTGSFTATGVVVSGGTSTFNILAANLTSAGTTTISIDVVTNTTSSCTTNVSAGTITDSFVITALPDVTSGTQSVSVAEPICLGNDGVVTFNASALVNGTYDIDFTLSGANTGSFTATGVVVSGGTSTFNILAANLTSAGTTTISIDVVTNTTSSCTTNVSAGTITDSFVITALPDVTSGTQSVSVAEPICLGNDGVVTFNASALVNGTYDIDFTLSGANTGSFTATGVVVSGGTSTFNILAANLTSAGTTTISIDVVTNTTSSCTTNVSAGTITDSFVITALPDVTSGTQSVSVAEPICLGNDGVVTFNASALVDGTYDIDFTLSGANTGSFTATGVVVSGGTSTFNILAANLTSAGTTTISIDVVTNTTSSCTTNVSAGTITDSFVITALPDVTSGTQSVSVAEPICLGNDGVVTFNASALVNGTYDIDFTLSGANTGSFTATGVVVSGGTSTFNILAANLTSAGTTTISIDVVTNTTSSCTTNVSAGTITDSFVITALPDVTSGTQSVSVAEPICLGNDGVVTFNASALVDGTYDIDFTLSGANTGSFTATGVVVSGGTSTFNILAANLTSAGTTTISIDVVTNTTSSCTTNVSAGTITDSFVITALPDVTSGTQSVSVAEPICLGNDGVVTFNASALVDGTYDIDFTLSGANTGSFTATGVVVSGGTSTFNILAANLTSAGTTTISIDVVTNTTSSCTTNVSAGTITDSFVITALPDVTSGTQSVSVAEPICLGNDGVVSYNSTSLTDGIYSINYTLSGANTGTFTATVIVVSGGNGSFTIPAVNLTSAGTTTITLDTIYEEGSSCSVSFVSGTITDDFVISELPDISGTNTISVSEPLCYGEDAIVTLTSSSLVNGTYDIDYTLSGANNGTYPTSLIVVSSGTGTFTIPSSVLINSGISTVEVLSISFNSNSCGSVFSSGIVTDDFEVIPLPDISGTNSVIATDICNDENAFITFNSSSLADGVYDIEYTLSGATNLTQIVSGVVVSGGTGDFLILNSDLSNTGTTTISINLIFSSVSGCTSTIENLNISDDFNFSNGPILSGEFSQTFCSGFDATIEELEVNYTNVYWYDSETSSTPLSPGTILIDNQTYYGIGIDPITGCESFERFEVYVSYERCDFLIPDGFSPNGDGINDVYHIVNGNLFYPNFYIEIYDRYGSLIKKGKEWDGTYNGNLLPSGIYFLIMNYNDGTKSPTSHSIYLNK